MQECPAELHNHHVTLKVDDVSDGISAVESEDKYTIIGELTLECIEKRNKGDKVSPVVTILNPISLTTGPAYKFSQFRQQRSRLLRCRPRYSFSRYQVLSPESTGWTIAINSWNYKRFYVLPLCETYD